MLPLLTLLALLPAGSGTETPRVLFFTHSAGYVHEVVRRPDPETLSPAERIFTGFAGQRFDVTCSQDCADISAANLANYAAVVFMTTSTHEHDLPVPGNGNQELVDWVAHGGAFVGLHCASDTNYLFAPYLDMVGGTFDGHPWHQEVRARVEDPANPITVALGTGFTITDEIYQFSNFRRYPLRVLLTLDPASVDISKGKREDGDYAMAWIKDWGEGRVFYTGLGHREEVWNDPRFQGFVLRGLEWAIHGPDLLAPPPAKARVLLGGSPRPLDAWVHRDGKAPAWKPIPGGQVPFDGKEEGADPRWVPEGNAVEVVAGTGDLVTRESFGDGLYHVEFMTPAMPTATGQARGNSGVYLQGRYEVQVLDSYGLEPGLGDCGSIYGKHVTAVNACRKPERWQTYDIEFRAPRFDEAGEKTANARLSVWHNGIHIHDDVEVDGPTTAGEAGEQPLGPLLLQDHGNPVRYRNVWILPR